MSYLTEQHQIKPNHPFYTELDGICFKSKNLYNYANYQIRQEFIFNKLFISSRTLQKTLVAQKQCDYYNNVPKVSQEVLRTLHNNWISFFRAIKDWKINPDKYLGRPKIPKYLDKAKGRFISKWDKQQISKKEYKKSGRFKLSGTNISIKSKIDIKDLFEIRVVPKSNYYVIEVVYKTKDVELKPKNDRVASIDLGLNNLMTVISNIKGFRPLVVKGNYVKSVNQFYNKKKAEYQSQLQKECYVSKKIDNLGRKRKNRIADYFHKATTKLVNHLVSNNIDTLVVGYNQGWKQDIKIGKVNNQNFVNVPFLNLINMLRYKCLRFGIELISTEESYTSKCSFLDNEQVGKHETYLGKRIKRGLFQSSDGKLINADVNGAFNILRKVKPEFILSEGNSGISVMPLRFTP